MSYQVLARKWRPKRFEELIGQDHITKTLQNTIKSNKVAHAYLLTGTRGVGKTTVARIFAKSLRCENLNENASPCLTCSSCQSIDDSSSLDYIEIDGASNTGVDNIRELIENVQYLPTSGTRKVYVIDEVHMLSVSAFNALLKTLEEPPAHVVFIFATTDPQKLLGTVLSRCQRFDFKHVDVETLKRHIDKISEAEGIGFSDDSVKYELAKYGEGSVRDTLSLLDQVQSLSSGAQIDEDTLLTSLGLAKTNSIKYILSAVFAADKDRLVKSYNALMQENVDLQKFSKQVLDSVFEIIENIDNQDSSKSLVDSEVLENITISELLWIYEVMLVDFKRAFESISPQRMLLFTFIKIALRSEVLGINGRKVLDKKKTEHVELKVEAEVQTEVEVERVIEKVEVKKDIKKSWDEVLEALFNEHKTIASNFEHGNILGDIRFQADYIELEIGFSHDDKIFYDYLVAGDVREKAKVALKNAFERNEDVRLKLTLLDAKEKEESQFLSKVEIENKKQEEEKERKLEEIKNNKYIKEAKDIFGAEINKIVINE